MDYRIGAISVNHNTSAYMELMLRSLFVRHQRSLDLRVTVFDNASNDDMRGLRSFAEQVDVPIAPSGFTLDTLNNSHGEILRRFVLERPDCTHYLFLDADVCFVQDDTIPRMLRELEADPTAFGIVPRMSWDGVTEYPQEAVLANPDVYAARLHPCCALVKNTALWRRVVEEIGLSCVQYLWAERAEYLDTFKLMTRVMRTHGLRHVIGEALIIHFFSVSYDWDTEAFRAQKVRHRDELLAQLRQAD